MSWAWPSSANWTALPVLLQVQRRRYLRFSPPFSIPNLHDAETGWYRDWYFKARLNDEVKHAARHDKHLALVYFRLPLAGKAITSRLRLYLTIRLGLMARELADGAGFFGRLTEEEFAICVSDTDNLGAAATVMVLMHTLSGLSADTAVASFPGDGEDGSEVLESARRAFHREHTNVVHLDAYRQHRSRYAA